MLNQTVPGVTQDTAVHGESFFQGFVAVIAQAPVITNGYQEQVKSGCLVTEVVDVVFTDQPLIYPAELLRNLAKHVRDYGLLVYCHDDLLHWLRIR